MQGNLGCTRKVTDFLFTLTLHEILTLLIKKNKLVYGWVEREKFRTAGPILSRTGI